VQPESIRIYRAIAIFLGLAEADQQMEPSFQARCFDGRHFFLWLAVMLFAS
jgi:hypothetical protein